MGVAGTTADEGAERARFLFRRKAQYFAAASRSFFMFHSPGFIFPAYPFESRKAILLHHWSLENAPSTPERAPARYRNTRQASGLRARAIQ